ncbi:MAG: DUF1559 domain-containing protein [Planctomycetaceae bacterium]|nr:DUF1559 domain-containing protein [Planctomycetaceae bacterium]
MNAAPLVQASGGRAEIASNVESVENPTEEVTGVELLAGEPVLELGLIPLEERISEQPLSDNERRKIAAENLEKVAEALRAYARDNGRLPLTYSSASGFQTLSWRVEILPYLGYKKLYDKFDKSVPWNRPPNDDLLKFIPDVYTSPERFDVKTNILMPAREGFIGGDGGGGALNEDMIEDGVANTLLLIEVNDDQAVPWTAPKDFEPTSKSDVAWRLFKLREDGVFAVWANGWTTLLAAGTAEGTIWDAMTTEAGDGLMAGKVHRDIPIENVSDAAVASVETEPIVEAESDMRPTVPESFLATRDPVPSAGEIAGVRERFRQVFAERLEEAKKDDEKRELAREMLTQAATMSEDNVGAYALQTAAMRLAIDAGGISELLEGIDQRVERFEVDAFEENMTWMLDFGRGVSQRDVETIDGMDYLVRAVKVIFAAIHDDRYVDASTVARYSFRLIDEDRDEDLPKNLTKLRGLLGQAKRDFDAASKSLAAYRLDPADGEAAADVGRFLCFIKGDWQRGLPLLAEGGSEPLQAIATRDLQGATDQSNQVALGDAWWDLAEKARSSVYRQSAQDRAKFWYEQAFEVMPDSLDRLHVKARLDEVEGSSATSPLAMIQQLADEVGVDLSVSLAATGKSTPSGGSRGSRGAGSRDEANEG